jgi:hypothetical protein
LGLGAHSYGKFSADEYSFVFDGDDEQRACAGTMLVDRHGRAESGDGTDQCRDDDLTQALIPFIAIRQLLTSFVDRLGNERTAIYERVLHRRGLRFFGRDLKLLEGIEVAKFVADRLRIERATTDSQLEYWGRPLKDLKPIDRPDDDLYTSFSNNFDYLENMSRTHYELVSGLSQNMVQRRNLGLSYRLSKQIWLWSARSFVPLEELVYRSYF